MGWGGRQRVSERLTPSTFSAGCSCLLSHPLNTRLQSVWPALTAAWETLTTTWQHDRRHQPGSTTPPGHRALMLHQSPRSSGPTGVETLHVVKFPLPPPRHEAIWSINKTWPWSMRGVSVDLSETCLRSTALPAPVAWSVKWCLWPRYKLYVCWAPPIFIILSDIMIKYILW